MSRIDLHGLISVHGDAREAGYAICPAFSQHYCAAPNTVTRDRDDVDPFSIQPADLKDSPPAKAVAERHQAWKTDLPKDEAALWDWLAALDDPSRAALLAHCVSFGVNAL